MARQISPESVHRVAVEGENPKPNLTVFSKWRHVAAQSAV